MLSFSAAAMSLNRHQTCVGGGVGRKVPLMMDSAAGNRLEWVLGFNVQFHGFSWSLHCKFEMIEKHFI